MISKLQTKFLEDIRNLDNFISPIFKILKKRKRKKEPNISVNKVSPVSSTAKRKEILGHDLKLRFFFKLNFRLEKQ